MLQNKIDELFENENLLKMKQKLQKLKNALKMNENLTKKKIFKISIKKIEHTIYINFKNVQFKINN